MPQAAEAMLLSGSPSDSFMPNWLTLEPELLASIARKLDYDDIATMRLVCKAWEKGASLGVKSLSVVSKSDLVSYPITLCCTALEL